jgi:proteasome-associated ATPase
MQRRSLTSEFPPGFLLERFGTILESELPAADKVQHLAALRAASPAEEIDRWLIERIGQLHNGLNETRQNQEKLEELLEKLTVPPYYLAIYCNTVDTQYGPSAVVRQGTELRAVGLGDAIAGGELTPGDEVLLSNERNVIVGKCNGSSLLCGEIASFSRMLPGGRCVVKSREEEFVVIATDALRASGLTAGDQVRFDRAFGLAFEKVERSRGEEYFLQDTPEETFDNIGGLEREIEQLKRIFSLHCFHADIVRKFRHKPKRSVLLFGPSGTGKTMLARALANFLARLSKPGRCRFMSVKPGALSSMWYGQTEANYREIFRVAREAAAEQPDIPIVIFFDEVDSIGSMRGESIHRIDDRVLNAFMAELSGLEDRGNIVVVTATNLVSSLDTALMRGGRLGDLVLKIPRPNRKAAREIFARHLPAEIPYACNGEGPLAAREAIINSAVSQIFAAGQDNTLATLTFRDGKRHEVRACEMINGAEIAAIAQAAVERACVRESEAGRSGVELQDVLAGVGDFLEKSARVLTPANCRNYLEDLPQDVDVVRVERVQRRVSNPYRYFNQVA